MRPDTFDPNSPPVITLEMIHGAQKHLISTCIITFSHVLFDAVLSSFPCRSIAGFRPATATPPSMPSLFRERKSASSSPPSAPRRWAPL